MPLIELVVPAVIKRFVVFWDNPAAETVPDLNFPKIMLLNRSLPAAALPIDVLRIALAILGNYIPS